jgi:hypothetical protein
LLSFSLLGLGAVDEMLLLLLVVVMVLGVLFSQGFSTAVAFLGLGT